MSQTPAPLPHAHERGEMRASDADRRLVEDVLNNAYVDGRLTREELDERLGRVWQARTFNELSPLTQDLVAPPTQYATRTQYATPEASVPGAVVDTRGAIAQTDSISCFLGDAKRLSGWRMRQRTSITCVMGDAVLDLTQATLESATPTVNVSCVMGDVKIRVPAGVQVVDNVSNVMGGFSAKGLRAGAQPDVTLTITGFTLMGDVKVIGPDHKSFAEKIFGK